MSRPRRSSKPAAASAPPSVRLGLRSFCEGNEGLVAEMLSVGALDAATLETKLLECMGVNSLSAEMLLARFFGAEPLGEYCESRLGKSGKGSEATLAARIAREWAKPSFSPLPPGSAMVNEGRAAEEEKGAEAETGGQQEGGEEEEKAGGAAEGGDPAPKRQKGVEGGGEGVEGKIS